MSVFEHYKILMPPHPLLPCCDIISHKFVQERSDDKRIKVTINWNFEANILTSKYRLHTFWSLLKKILPAEKNFWTKFIIILFLILLLPVPHDIQICLNFAMMPSQHGTRISRFREKQFHKRIPYPKFAWPLVHEIQVWTLLRVIFWLMTPLRESKLQYFEKVIS